MNKFNIFDVVKFKNEDDTYKIYAINYYHNKGVVYEIWRVNDLKEYDDVPEDKLELVKSYA